MDSKPFYGRWLDYNEYLISDHWRLLRQQKLDSMPSQKCEKCGRDHSLQVHHLTYCRFPDCPLTDLQVLCEKCHKKTHNLNYNPRFKRNNKKLIKPKQRELHKEITKSELKEIFRLWCWKQDRTEIYFAQCNKLVEFVENSTNNWMVYRGKHGIQKMFKEIKMSLINPPPGKHAGLAR